MSGNSNIAWTEKTWNPVRGCERVSPGCVKCYAEILAARHSYPAKDGRPAGWGHGLAKWVIRPDGTKEARWTGVIRPIEAALDAPMRWRDPHRVFVNSMSDLFHEDVPEAFIDKVFAVMARARQHTFQILTKRADRMRAYLSDTKVTDRVFMAGHEVSLCGLASPARWPLSNVWMGVSVERQEEADERIPHLLRTPAAVRFISAEPLLGQIDLRAHLAGYCPEHDFESGMCTERDHTGVQRLHWVITGGESGPGYRAMAIEHARGVIGQCQEYGLPIFVKQDHGPRPGLQGRFTDAEFALKEYPQ